MIFITNIKIILRHVKVVYKTIQKHELLKYIALKIIVVENNSQS